MDIPNIDDPQEFEALMLRWWARYVRQICEHNGDETPPGAAAILGDHVPAQSAVDSQAVKDWCERNGLEWVMHDFRTNHNFLHPADDPAISSRNVRH